MKVFLVCYSEYHEHLEIVGVFASQAAAEKCVDEKNAVCCWVEGYDLQE